MAWTLETFQDQVQLLEDLSPNALVYDRIIILDEDGDEYRYQDTNLIDEDDAGVYPVLRVSLLEGDQCIAKANRKVLQEIIDGLENDLESELDSDGWITVEMANISEIADAVGSLAGYSILNDEIYSEIEGEFIEEQLSFYEDEISAAIKGAIDNALETENYSSDIDLDDYLSENFPHMWKAYVNDLPGYENLMVALFHHWDGYHNGGNPYTYVYGEHEDYLNFDDNRLGTEMLKNYSDLVETLKAVEKDAQETACQLSVLNHIKGLDQESLGENSVTVPGLLPEDLETFLDYHGIDPAKLAVYLDDAPENDYRDLHWLVFTDYYGYEVDAIAIWEFITTGGQLKLNFQS